MDCSRRRRSLVSRRRASRSSSSYFWKWTSSFLFKPQHVSDRYDGNGSKEYVQGWSYLCSTDSSKAPTPFNLNRSSKAAENSSAMTLQASYKYCDCMRQGNGEGILRLRPVIGFPVVIGRAVVAVEAAHDG